MQPNIGFSFFGILWCKHIDIANKLLPFTQMNRKLGNVLSWVENVLQVHVLIGILLTVLSPSSNVGFSLRFAVFISNGKEKLL